MSDAVEAPAVAAVAEAAPTEPAKAEEKAPEAPPKPKPGDFARKAAAERERVQKAQAGKAEHEEFQRTKAERDALKAEIEKANARRQTYIQNPVQVLMDAFPGMEPAKAFEIIGEAARNHGKAPVQTETYAIKQELEAMKAQAAAEKEAAQVEAKKAQEAAAKETETAFRAEIAEFVKEHAETYELTALYEQSAAVFEVMDAHFRATFDPETGKGEILTKKQAAEKVEAHLEGLGEKMLKAKKMAAKLKPAEPETPKTLTNDLAQSTFSGSAKTEQERMARAMAALAKFE
jgi:hypothetical protein